MKLNRRQFMILSAELLADSAMTKTGHPRTAFSYR